MEEDDRLLDRLKRLPKIRRDVWGIGAIDVVNDVVGETIVAIWVFSELLSEEEEASVFLVVEFRETHKSCLSEDMGTRL